MNEANTPRDEMGIKSSSNSEVSLKIGQTNCPFETFVPNPNQDTRMFTDGKIQKAVLYSPLQNLAKLPPAESVENQVEVQKFTEEESSEWVIEPDSEVNEVETVIESEADEIPIMGTQLWQNDCSQVENRDTNKVAESEIEQDWVAEPDQKEQAVINSEFQQMLGLNKELRCANDRLYTQVEELKSTLADTQKNLEKQKRRSSVAETMLQQQNQELVAVQERTKSLFGELETALKNIQRQENLIESYKSHLESSQQRLAQLERECTRLQSQSNEQSHQLSHSENTCRELRTRLMRQQRQTLQFKAALEKCLDSSVPGDDVESDITGKTYSSASTQSSAYTQKLRSILKNAQPIQPWSGDTEPLFEDSEKFDDFGQESITSSAQFLSADVNTIVDDFEEKASVWDDSSTELAQSEAEESESKFNNLDNNSHSNSHSNSELNLQSSDDLTQNNKGNGLEELSITDSANLNDLEEQLDRTIRMFFASEHENKASAPLVPEYPVPEYIEENRIDPPVWEAFATTVEEDISDDVENISSEINDIAGITENPTLEVEDSPSPVIYPNRPSKRRKSFASVELPSFPKKLETE